MSTPHEWPVAPLPIAQPLAVPLPPSPTPGCSGTGCTAQPLVQWQRRSADDPTGTVAVFACGPHAIAMDLAARVHAPDCQAPNTSLLPDCGCTPEPLPGPEPVHAEAQPLPDHWT